MGFMGRGMYNSYIDYINFLQFALIKYLFMYKTLIKSYSQASSYRATYAPNYSTLVYIQEEQS